MEDIEKIVEDDSPSVKSIVRMGVLAAVVLVLFGFGKTLYDKREEEASKNFNILYKEVAQSADTDEDGFTSHKEWANVYKPLGLTYNIHYSDPKNDLGIERMEKYLKNN